MKKINVLVTGAGSGVGQSIIKSLKISKLPCNIIPADISFKNAFLYLSKKSLIVPKVENEKQCLRWYLTNLKKMKIDVLMIGSEFDINFFKKYSKEIEKKTSCKVCLSKPKTIEISDDKYLTQMFLKKNNLPYLKTYSPKNIKEAKKSAKKINFPLVIKPRFGTSSKDVYMAKNQKELKYFFKLIKKPIIQELIGKNISDYKLEYTCSFFTTKEKEILGPIILKRKLNHGTSWITEIVKNKKINDLILKIANLVDNEGSFNIQLRVGKRGPIPFEFNSRFSGTTFIRSYFGFNEPFMYIKNYIEKQKLKKPNIKKGTCFRYVNEIFLNKTSERFLSKRLGLGKVFNWTQN